MNHYEAVFILNPVLSEDQVKETVKKFEDFLISEGSEIISVEHWGLKKLAYPIQNKQSGFYNLIDFKAAKYFDITANNWKLDKLVPSVLEASKLCKTINHLDS